ncbi:MAG: NADP-dependent isocitrate dehydrogenase [Bacteroidia bacterium]|nr:NADP-dependent isocitrate dehydrogenase [Bacteroidia bacterium]MCX7651950.1 NADP-dependent isocitrate dehydrogenase [Bacteroidia bacterium]MDW8416101.1 NADP-dependent isocitrate dehydrogenase [Bacteroidia bacterium]
MSKVPIAVAYGDGIGPEIMSACLHILQEGGAQIDIHTIEIGEKIYLQGYTAGIKPEAIQTIRDCKVFYKAPITTPQGGGFKSLNVTTRKLFNLFANVRPCVSYHPFIDTKFPKLDVVIVRENEEDLYAGIEHQQTPEVYQVLKLITRPGTERIIRYAFEYARAYGRKKVTCMTKDNIMKLTDGLFHKVFDEIGAEYPEIEKEHWIIDIGTAKLADTPEMFDVVVTLNLYGDILSDMVAQIAGSVGLAGSANIGPNVAMFEAIHGSAPRRAGQNLANPSGLLHAGIMMMVHIGQPEVAERVHNAWLRTIEEGYHTYDIYREGVSREKVGTKEFAQAVVRNLGKQPEHFKPVRYTQEGGPAKVLAIPPYQRPTPPKKDLIGIDIFVNWTPGRPEELAEKIQAVLPSQLKLTMISNRGTAVWPQTLEETFLVDHWRTRLLSADGKPISHEVVIEALKRYHEAGLDFIKTEHLYLFDGVEGYSKGQGE